MYSIMYWILNELNKMNHYLLCEEEVGQSAKWLFEQYEKSLNQGFPTTEIIEKMNELCEDFAEGIIFDDDCTIEDMIEFFNELYHNL